MKLANPRTIQTTINEERRMDIDNGIKIARRVDNLRETLSVLETRHALFNEATTKELREMTENLNEEILAKELIIADLERKKAKLLLPVTLKWDDVNAKEQELIKEKEKLISLRNELTDYKQELDSREKQLSLDEENYTNLKKEIDIQADKVSNSSLEAQNTLLNARELERATKLLLKEEKAKIDKKSKQIELREENVVTRELQLEKEEKEIIKTKLQLADQRATLERAMSRIK
jgi:hypothetical protein